MAFTDLQPYAPERPLTGATFVAGMGLRRRSEVAGGARHHARRLAGGPGPAQPTARLTSVVIRSAASSVSSVTAYEVGHRPESSSSAASVENPNVE